MVQRTRMPADTRKTGCVYDPHPEVPKTDGTVLVNGKPVSKKAGPSADETRTSEETKKAAASKTAEQKLAGQTQEARLREQLESQLPSTQDDVQPPNIWTATEDLNVRINGKAIFRKDDSKTHCDGPQKFPGNKAKP